MSQHSVWPCGEPHTNAPPCFDKYSHTKKKKNSSPGVNLPPMDGWMDGKDGGEDVFVLCAPGREWTLCGNGDRP